MPESEHQDIDYLINLYNGYSAVAERVDAAHLQHIHIPTPLEGKIRQWLIEKKDIILTGNPGDGKTHLMQILKNELQQLNAGYEEDASQRTAVEVLEKWRQSRQARHPFMLAINHAPLRRLAEVTKGDAQFDFLYRLMLPEQQANSEIENFVVYSDEQRARYVQNTHNLLIIDLSQRELLTDETIIDGLLNKLCDLASVLSCEHVLPEGCQRCPIRYNVQALSDENIRKNVKAALALVARRGFHATMRDLVGLFTFAITGGVKCEALWLDGEAHDYYDYYNLLYNPKARNKLFEALRDTFDPGQYADAKMDMPLWMNEVKDGWWRNDEIQQRPSDLKSLQNRKRRYFFEYVEPVEEKLQRMLSVTEQNFDRLVQGGWGEQQAVEQLVEMINLLYAPLRHGEGQNQGYRFRLRLWNEHRYSVGPSPGYVAMRSISSDKLTVYYPALNPKYEEAIEIRRDHILLAVKRWEPGAPALRVDWEMYQALAAAKEGKLIDVQPYHILRRLDLFLRSLGFEVGRAYAEETVEWSDYRQRRVVTIRVHRDEMRYQPL
ncbi:MAG: hypothetical protein L0332_31890 [Chloroflexi bacterium]|nr:hypothetical protein [Nitrososphaera sp.]MCI0645438.1 hypothetical protein [Chloroflexota bacterium]MCI0731304.1 hypothetical protein [Chloroflexota bacterium]